MLKRLSQVFIGLSHRFLPMSCLFAAKWRSAVRSAVQIVQLVGEFVKNDVVVPSRIDGTFLALCPGQNHLSIT